MARLPSNFLLNSCANKVNGERAKLASLHRTTASARWLCDLDSCLPPAHHSQPAADPPPLSCFYTCPRAKIKNHNWLRANKQTNVCCQRDDLAIRVFVRQRESLTAFTTAGQEQLESPLNGPFIQVLIYEPRWDVT